MEHAMRTMSAKDAKNSFGMLLDFARAAPVQVAKHGRPVVVVISVEEFQRLNGPMKKGKGAEPASQAGAS
jgi:prevent-host-death family protein